jgi:hypothetical protein
MDFVMLLAVVVFLGFGARALYLLFREDKKKDLLLTVAMWGLALVVWGLYLVGTRNGGRGPTVVFFGLLTFALSILGLFRLVEENPSEFGKEL